MLASQCHVLTLKEQSETECQQTVAMFQDGGPISAGSRVAQTIGRRVIFYIVAPLDLFHCSKYSSSLDCYRFVFENPKEFVRERIVIPRQKELSADGGFSEG